jgi:hypothetical protein
MAVKGDSEIKTLLSDINTNFNILPVTPVTTNSIATNVTDDVMITQIQKLDSIHDFGDTRGSHIGTDAVRKITGNIAEYSCNQMTLSFIQEFSFPTDPAKINTWIVSQFSCPGSKNIPIFVEDLENYLISLSISGKTIKQKKEQFIYLPYDKTNSNISTNFQIIKENIYKFYESNYKCSNTTKINLVIDTPGDFTKVMKSNPNQQFAYVIVQESAYDSCTSKSSILKPSSLLDSYHSNVYIEKPLQSRDYTKSGTLSPSGKPINIFESNYTIRFTGFKFNPKNSTEIISYPEFIKTGTTSKSFSCILNQKDHPTCAAQIVKKITPFSRGNNETTPIGNLNVPNPSNKIQFSNSFNKFAAIPDKHKEAIDFEFTKKRAGDGLQGRICQSVNNGYPLTCYKMIDAAKDKQIENMNLDITQTVTITKLVLVTIDRVLFAYCIYKNIPVIFAGKGFFCCFNPSLKVSISLTPLITGGYNPRITIGGLGTPERGLGAPERGPGTPEREEEPIIYQRESPENIIVIEEQPQEEPRDDAQVARNVKEWIRDTLQLIPYTLYKVLPKIFRHKIDENSIIIPRLITYLEDTDDESIQTIYANDSSCLYRKKYIELMGTTENLNSDSKQIIYIIQPVTGDASPENIMIQILHNADNDGFKFKYYHGAISKNGFDIKLDDIMLCLLGTISDKHLTKSVFNADLHTLFYYLNVEYYQEGAEEVVEEVVAEEIRGGAQVNYTNIPLLDMYYHLFFVKNISLDQSKLMQNNLLYLISYFNLFDMYETFLCIDKEEFIQSFTEERKIELTCKIPLYVMFKFLLEDFIEKKDKICYGLLEYFLKTDIIISTDLSDLIYYLFSGFTGLPGTVNQRIHELISSGQISEDNPIFKESVEYFTRQLPDKVYQKVREINAVLTGESNDQSTIHYIKSYLSVYGFMNIFIDFNDNLVENSSLEQRASVPVPVPVQQSPMYEYIKPIREFNELLHKRITKKLRRNRNRRSKSKSKGRNRKSINGRSKSKGSRSRSKRVGNAQKLNRRLKNRTYKQNRVVTY